MKQQLLNHFNVVRHVLSLIIVMLLPTAIWAQTDYGLTVAGVQVTSDNAGHITGKYLTTGTAVFDASTNTLTLTDVTIEYGGVQSGLESLTIIFNGTNTIQSYIGANTAVAGTHNVTLQMGTAGSTMYLSNTVGTSIIDGFDKVSMDGLYISSETPYAYNATAKQFKGVQNSGVVLQTATITSTPHYALWIANTQLSDANKANVFPNDESFNNKVSFDNTSNTLSLQDVDLAYNVLSVLSDLTISVSGDCKVGGGDSATAVRNVHPSGTLTLKSTGSGNQLAFNNDRPIRDFSTLTLSGLYWDGDYTYGPAIIEEWDADKQQMVQLTGKHLLNSKGSEAAYAIATSAIPYQLYLGDIRVNSENASNILGENYEGKASYNVSDNTLTLEKVELPMGITSSLDNLTIKLKGANSLSTESPESVIQYNGKGTGSLSIVNDGESQGSLSLICYQEDYSVISGFTSVNFGEFNIVSESTGVKYDTNSKKLVDAQGEPVTSAQLTPTKLYIGDIPVTTANADDVLGDGGTVKFASSGAETAAPVNTLTLNGAALTAPLIVGLDNLTIDIQGTNSITTSTTCIQKMENTNPSLTFKSTSDEVGSLTLTNTAEDYSGVMSSDYYGKFIISQELAPIISRYGTTTSNTYYFTAGEVHNIQIVPSFGVTVGDVQIYAGNAENVTGSSISEGKVSFDTKTSTLTLDNAHISGVISTSLKNLTIELIGDNTLSQSGSYATLQSQTGSPVAMTIQSSAGTLTMNMPYTEAGTFADSHVMLNIEAPLVVISGSLTGNTGNENTVIIGVSYGITITKGDVSCLINNANKTNVLGDANVTAPSVVFDGYNRLVLNNAELTSIVVNVANSLPAKGLDIYLEGNSKITNTAGYAISYEGAAAVRGLSFHTGSDAPGTLVCTNSSAITSTPYEGFYESYFNNLAGFVENNKVTVKMPLGLIVDASTTVSTLVYDSNPAGRDDAPLDNVAFDNVLYTLHDDGTQAAADGFDQERNLVVVNSLMTDEQVKAIDTKQYIPGSNEYKARFTGLTFVVPAGTGTIKLKLRTNSPGSYAFHVMVDYQDPVEIIPTAALSEYVVDYACSDVSYVKVYLVALDAPAPALDSHRAGPKASISGGIGGMKVSASMISPAPDAGAAYYQMGKGDWERKSGTKGIVVNNADVTDLPDNAFDTSSPAPGLHRAPATDEITFIDLTATKVTGKSYDRTTGAFAGIPESTLIYLPGGNTATGKNFVIGGICEDMQLDGTSDNTFEVSKKFTASQATFERVFEAGENKCYTVYLPYSIDTEKVKGNFFEYDGFDAEKRVVKMKAATGVLAANKAYIFSPTTTGGIGSVNCVEVEVPETGVAKPADNTEAEGLHGVYEYHQWTSAPSNIYCYAAADKGDIKAGQFGKVGAGEDIKPFCAYLRINAATTPSSVVIDWGNGATSIVPLDKQQVGQGADGWYTITGLRLPEKPSQKGVYIHQGKKVAVK